MDTDQSPPAVAESAETPDADAYSRGKLGESNWLCECGKFCHRHRDDLLETALVPKTAVRFPAEKTATDSSCTP